MNVLIALSLDAFCYAHLSRDVWFYLSVRNYKILMFHHFIQQHSSFQLRSCIPTYATTKMGMTDFWDRHMAYPNKRWKIRSWESKAYSWKSQYPASKILILLIQVHFLSKLFRKQLTGGSAQKSLDWPSNLLHFFSFWLFANVHTPLRGSPLVGTVGLSYGSSDEKGVDSTLSLWEPLEKEHLVVIFFQSP